MKTNPPILLILPGGSGDPESPKIQCMVNVAESKQIDYILPNWKTEIMDPFHRLELVRKTGIMDKERVVIAGSSLGGYIASLVANERQVDGLYLLVLILGKTKDVSCFPRLPPTYTVIINAWNDEEIPLETAFNYAQANHARFHMVAGSHSLEEHLDFISKEFSRFLDLVMANASYGGDAGQAAVPQR